MLGEAARCGGEDKKPSIAAILQCGNITVDESEQRHHYAHCRERDLRHRITHSVSEKICLATRRFPRRSVTTQAKTQEFQQRVFTWAT